MTFGLSDVSMLYFGTFRLLDFGTFGHLDFGTLGLLDFGTLGLGISDNSECQGQFFDN